MSEKHEIPNGELGMEELTKKEYIATRILQGMFASGKSIGKDGGHDMAKLSCRVAEYLLDEFEEVNHL